MPTPASVPNRRGASDQQCVRCGNHIRFEGAAGVCEGCGARSIKTERKSFDWSQAPPGREVERVVTRDSRVLVRVPSGNSPRFTRLISPKAAKERSSPPLQDILAITQIADQLKLKPDTVRTGRQIFSEAKKHLLGRGRRLDDLMRASLYAAARIRGEPRELSDFGGRTVRIRRTYIALKQAGLVTVPPVSPQDFLPRFIGSLNLRGETQDEVQSVAKQVTERGLFRGTASGTAAAIIWIACRRRGEQRTQEEIESATGVTKLTIRNRSKAIEEGLRQH